MLKNRILSKMNQLLIHHRELVAYVVAGVLTTAVNYAVYGTLTMFCGLGITLSNTIAWVAAVTVAFFTNKAFVFQKRDWSPKALLREGTMFVGSRILSGVVGIGLVPVLMTLGITQSVLGVPGFAAKFLAESVALVLSYFLSKYAIFKK